MKVLFAVSNEEISESIVKRYQKEYKEILSYKNVYYFNAILKEIQKDKTYDRIVISEDLEAFTHTQYDQIDKFIFDKLDSISDEASNLRGNDTPIILICSDRRTKSEQMLVKLFGIGIYNAIIGNDRSVEEVCKLINKPRLKKEAKSYYKIDSEEVNYQSENENDVSEMEIRNILAHYKSLGKNEDRFVDSFNNIAAQYNDTQLRIIAKFLPINVKAVLEERSPKYQQVMSFNNRITNNLRQDKNKKEDSGTSEKLLKSKVKNMPLSKPVVIPSAVNMGEAKKLSKLKNTSLISDNKITNQQEVVQRPAKTVNVNDVPRYGTVEQPEVQQIPQIEEDDFVSITEQDLQPVQNNDVIEENRVEPVKRKRGRPRKNPEQVQNVQEGPVVKRKRGRPRKNSEILENSEPTTLPGFEDEESLEDNTFTPILSGFEDVEDKTNDVQESGRLETENEKYGPILPGFEDEEESDDYVEPQNRQTIKPAQEEPIYQQVQPNYDYNNNYYNSSNVIREDTNRDEYIQTIDLSSLLTPDKKIASFVGTSKNGTSFIVNNIAELFSTMGINTAILDTTKNRNSYYIYTKNEEALRKTAAYSIEGLVQGLTNGIEVNKNLTVYTSLPDESDSIKEVDKVLETLVKNYSVILIDCDYNTPVGYFKQSQQTYLVQSMDILAIQPLTAFLRELKAKSILDEKKLRIIINKAVKVRGVNEKTIIGGMAFYNDPAMSFMTELFDRNLIKYITIPFEEEIYAKYLESIINCDVNLKGYTKSFMQVLKELGSMIYPLVSGQGTYRPPSASYKNQTPGRIFSKYE